MPTANCQLPNSQPPPANYLVPAQLRQRGAPHPDTHKTARESAEVFDLDSVASSKSDPGGWNDRSVAAAGPPIATDPDLSVAITDQREPPAKFSKSDPAAEDRANARVLSIAVDDHCAQRHADGSTK